MTKVTSKRRSYISVDLLKQNLDSLTRTEVNGDAYVHLTSLNMLIGALTRPDDSCDFRNTGWEARRDGEEPTE